MYFEELLDSQWDWTHFVDSLECEYATRPWYAEFFKTKY
jgi:hypothetical protein